MSRARRPLLINNPATYDAARHGMVNSDTGALTPNINAGTHVSPVDAAAAAAGTHATPASAAFEKAFPNSAINRATGVPNPPPPTGGNGVPTVDRATGAVMGSPAGFKTQNQMKRENHVEKATAVKAGESTGATPAAPLNVKSDAVQSMLDRVTTPVAGMTGNNPAAGVTRTAGTGYGGGSVRFDRGAAGPSAPIMSEDGKTQIGVGRGNNFNIEQARKNLQASFPEAFKAGTPENKAFLEHANQYGEQSAHENLDQVMQPIINQRIAAAGGGPAAAQVRGDLNTPGSTADVLANKAVAANTNPPGALFDKNSTLGKVTGAIGAIPGQIKDATGGIVSGALKATGLTPIGQGVAGAAATGLGAVAGAAGSALGGILNPIGSAAHGLSQLFSKTDATPQTAALPSAPPPAAAPAPINSGDTTQKPRTTLGAL